VKEQVVGLDISPEALNGAKRLQASHKDINKVQFTLQDFFSYEPERPFELIFDYTYVLHCPRDHAFFMQSLI
jgi:methylase of polypeptide subunit release factors